MSPAPKPASVPTLAQVLTAGNDAQGQDITGLGPHAFPRGWQQDASTPAVLETKGGTLFVNAPGTIEFEGRGADPGTPLLLGGNRIGQIGDPVDGGDADTFDARVNAINQAFDDHRAAYVDPTTGTLADVVASLVAAGLMDAA